MNKALLLSLALVAFIHDVALTQEGQSILDAGSFTGMEGIISITPVQGGPTRQGESASRPLVKITFEVKQNGRVAKSFQTDDRGQFHVELRPGHYTIARKDWKGAIGFYGPFEVEVTQGKTTKVEWKCDTGMR